ncbi:unnamed protein product [Nyctereutes procyonoides]|uniref:(raccoon dog) hypothetical protein n=1 Tax=Nyctereutes procyonoides TaxID=34880 RepID=A0A811XU50_NYCPR|nr:unnamed protein product [Nyctereutes procyonoides]
MKCREKCTQSALVGFPGLCRLAWHLVLGTGHGRQRRVRQALEERCPPPGGLAAEELRQGQDAALELEDTVPLSAQTPGQAEVDELYQQVGPLGQGHFGRVLLVTHRQEATPPRGFLCEFCVGLSVGAHRLRLLQLPTEPVLHGDLVTAVRAVRPGASALEHMHPRRAPGAPGHQPEDALVWPRCRQVRRSHLSHTGPRGTLLRLAGPPIPHRAPELCAPPQGLPIPPAPGPALLPPHWPLPLGPSPGRGRPLLRGHPHVAGVPPTRGRPQPWLGLTLWQPVSCGGAGASPPKEAPRELHSGLPRASLEAAGGGS